MFSLRGTSAIPVKQKRSHNGGKTEEQRRNNEKVAFLLDIYNFFAQTFAYIRFYSDLCISSSTKLLKELRGRLNFSGGLCFFITQSVVNIRHQSLYASIFSIHSSKCLHLARISSTPISLVTYLPVAGLL